jgi:hypothetical protein
MGVLIVLVFAVCFHWFDFWFGSGEYIFNPLDTFDDAKDTIQRRIKMLESANETENGWRNVVDGRVAHYCTQRGMLDGIPYDTSV